MAAGFRSAAEKDFAVLRITHLKNTGLLRMVVKLLSKLNRNDHLKLGNSRMEVFMIYIWQAIGKLNPSEIVQLCSSYSSA